MNLCLLGLFLFSLNFFILITDATDAAATLIKVNPKFPLVKTKPGYCPGFFKPLLRKSKCRYDYECSGALKCCDSVYGTNHCVKPVEKPVIKPGTCPSKNGIGLCFVKCRDDSDCDGNEKCCLTQDHGTECRKPKKVIKPGKCPKPIYTAPRCPKIAYPSPQCEGDENCKGQEKCCSNGCWRSCKKPENKVPIGECPETDGVVSICLFIQDFNCISDSQCNSGERCCKYGCSRICTSTISRVNYDEEDGHLHNQEKILVLDEKNTQTFENKIPEIQELNEGDPELNEEIPGLLVLQAP